MPGFKLLYVVKHKAFVLPGSCVINMESTGDCGGGGIALCRGWWEVFNQKGFNAGCFPHSQMLGEKMQNKWLGCCYKSSTAVFTNQLCLATWSCNFKLLRWCVNWMDHRRTLRCGKRGGASPDAEQLLTRVNGAVKRRSFVKVNIWIWKRFL